MIGAAMLFSLTVSVLLSGAAHALEKTAALCHLPRRGTWAAALLCSWIVPLTMLMQATRTPEPAVFLRSAPASIPDSLTSPRFVRSAISSAHWQARPGVDEILTVAWGSTSCGLLLIWAVAAVRLYRRASRWPVTRIDGDAVSITDGFGPAVLGYVQPRIVMPRAVFSQPNAIRTIAMKHEQSHIAAHDPALLLLALVLVVLAPWNLPLWWQLRRLRFAIEVDCDARVLKKGVEPASYGETLLSISQQSGPVPLGMVALTEPTSQLERRVRIMMTGPVRFRKALIGFSLAVATSLVFVATGLTAPAVGGLTAELRKPPPGHAGAPPEKFVALIKERYPELGSQTVAGTPVLIALFNHDGSIARSDKDVFAGPPRDFKPTKALFERVGLTPEAVGPMGVQSLEFPKQTVLVAYTERNDSHKPSTSNVFPDSRMIDRALAKRFFPGAVEQGVAAGEGIWVLFDRDGTVLRTGQESFNPDKLIPLLELRYPGIKATEMTVTPVVDANLHPKIPAGGELQLWSVWLDEGSPRPGA